MSLKCDTERILDSDQYTAPNLIGEDTEYVKYVYRAETPVEMLVGVEVTETTYTKILENGQKVTIFHSLQRFHQIDDDWYALEYDTVTKKEWDKVQ